MFAMFERKFQWVLARRGLSSVTNASQLASLLPDKVREYVAEKAAKCQPKEICVCDGSEEERVELLAMMQKEGQIKKLTKYKNCWLVRTDPADVARVESKTIIATRDRQETIPITADGVQGQLGNWMHVEELDKLLNDRFEKCMNGGRFLSRSFNV